MTNSAPESTIAFETLGVRFALSDVSRELARRAYQLTSHFAEERADSTRAGYLAHMRDAAERFEEAARQFPDRNDRAADLLMAYKTGYLSRLNDYLSARAGCASWFITGRSNFPVHRQRKKWATADRRSDELHEYATTRLARMVRLITRPPRLTAHERADDLRRRIEQAQATQDRMKEANKVIRDKKLAQKLAAFGLTTTDALVSLGLSEVEARSIQKPDFARRIGYPDYRLTNNAAEIRRLKKRLAEELAKAAGAATKSAPTQDYDTATEGQVNYEECPDENRVRLTFEGKPSAATRELLKGHGFRWSPNAGAWQRFLTGNGIYAAREVLRALHATPTTQEEESAA